MGEAAGRTEHRDEPGTVAGIAAEGGIDAGQGAQQGAHGGGTEIVQVGALLQQQEGVEHGGRVALEHVRRVQFQQPPAPGEVGVDELGRIRLRFDSRPEVDEQHVVEHAHPLRDPVVALHQDLAGGAVAARGA